jgi:hypothetical protein
MKPYEDQQKDIFALELYQEKKLN